MKYNYALDFNTAIIKTDDHLELVFLHDGNELDVIQIEGILEVSVLDDRIFKMHFLVDGESVPLSKLATDVSFDLPEICDAYERQEEDDKEYHTHVAFESHPEKYI